MAFGKRMTSAEKANIPVLPKYLCKVCEKWIPSSLLSKKQLDIYRSDVAMGKKVTAITAKLKCRACSGDGRQELKCLGQCGFTKSIDEFSRAQRLSSGDQWCKACVLWRESHQPGTPAEASDITPIPVQAPPAQSKTRNKAMIASDNEDDSGSDADESLGYNVGGSSKATSSAQRDVSSGYHGSSQTATSHQGNENLRTLSVSSKSNPYEDGTSRGNTSTLSDSNVDDISSRTGNIKFTGDDFQGQAYPQKRLSPVAGSGVNVHGARQNQGRSASSGQGASSGNWAKPAGKRQVAASPEEKKFATIYSSHQKYYEEYSDDERDEM